MEEKIKPKEKKFLNQIINSLLIIISTVIYLLILFYIIYSSYTFFSFNLYPTIRIILVITIEFLYNKMKIFDFLLDVFAGNKHFIKEIIFHFIFMTQFIFISILLKGLILKKRTLIWHFKKVYHSLKTNLKYSYIVFFTSLIFFYFLIFTLPIVYTNRNIGNYSIVPETIFLISFIIYIFYLLFDKISLTKDNIESSDFLYSDKFIDKIDKNEENYKYVGILKSIIEKQKAKNYFSILLNGRWGIGKTSILKTLLEDKEVQKDFEIIWVSVWEYKKIDDVLFDIEKQFIDFFYSDSLTLRKKHIDFFKIIVGLYDKNLSELFNLFNCSSEISLENARKEIQEEISNALKRDNKKKVLIFFDDADRVLDKNECFKLLKIIRYLIGFEKCISITSADLDKIVSLVKNVRINNNTNYSPSYYFDFVYKIFNSIITIPDMNNQSELLKFIKNEFEIKLEKLFKDYEFDIDDKNNITAEIKQLINGNKFEGIFYNFREVKLSINDFLLKLIEMNNSRRKLRITQVIYAGQIFILSILKNVNIEFYNEFIQYVWNTINVESSTNILDYFKSRLNDLSQNNGNNNIEDVGNKRILNILKLFGYDFVANKHLYGYILEQKEIKYYLYPMLEYYQIPFQELNNHYQEFDGNIAVDIVINFVNKYKNELVDENIDHKKKLILEYVKSVYEKIKTEKDIEVKVIKFVTIIYAVCTIIRDESILFNKKTLDGIFTLLFNAFLVNNTNEKDFNKKTLDRIISDKKLFKLFVSLMKKEFIYYKTIEEQFTDRISLFHSDNKAETISFFNEVVSANIGCVETIALYFSFIIKNDINSNLMFLQDAINKIDAYFTIVNLNSIEPAFIDSLIKNIIILYERIEASDVEAIKFIMTSKLSYLLEKLITTYKYENYNLSTLNGIILRIIKIAYNNNFKFDISSFIKISTFYKDYFIRNSIQLTEFVLRLNEEQNLVVGSYDDIISIYEHYEDNTLKEILKIVPQNINSQEFDIKIITKLNDDDDRVFLQECYQAGNNSPKIKEYDNYVLASNLSTSELKRIGEIFKSIAYKY